MSSDVVVALLSVMGTIVGSCGGIIASSKLINYRLQTLEEKVNKHNNIIERTYKLEGRVDECVRDLEEIRKKVN